MGLRSELHSQLKSILGSDHVYFQPPATVKMEYPAIVYNLSAVDMVYADDQPYAKSKKYSVTLICKDPDNTICDSLAELPMIRFTRFYTADNLNHYNFEIYY